MTFDELSFLVRRHNDACKRTKAGQVFPLPHEGTLVTTSESKFGAWTTFDGEYQSTDGRAHLVHLAYCHTVPIERTACVWNVKPRES